MSAAMIREARKLLSGKSGRLEDQELEYLAQEITKLGFKIGPARVYAYAPTLLEKVIRDLEEREEQVKQIRRIIGPR